MRNLILSFLVVAFALPLWALDRDDFTNGTFGGSIVYAEYFIDADPGFGMGTAIPVPNGSTANLAASLSVPTDDLTTGPHELFVRVQNSSGDWSQVANHLFRISPLLKLSPPEIVAAEYFLDDDPGVGAGTAIGVEPGPAVTASANITIPEGARVLYFRAQDDQGWWSQPVPHVVRTFAPPLPDALAWDLVHDDTVLASGQQSISPATPDFTTTLVTDPLPVDLSPGPAQLRVNTVFAGAFRAPAQAVTLVIREEAGPDNWLGYPLYDSGNVNSEPFLGWVNVQWSPWVYSFSTGGFLYVEESLLDEVGGWVYLHDPAGTRTLAEAYELSQPVDTGKLLGEATVISPWVWSAAYGKFVYLPKDLITPSGSWSYWYR